MSPAAAISPLTSRYRCHGAHESVCAIASSLGCAHGPKLELADPENAWTVGQWTKNDGKLQSPKRFGARLELPYRPPTEYRLTMVVEPLDHPNGLILGQRSGSQRFVTLFDYANGLNAQFHWSGLTASG